VALVTAITNPGPDTANASARSKAINVVWRSSCNERRKPSGGWNDGRCDGRRCGRRSRSWGDALAGADGFVNAVVKSKERRSTKEVPPLSGYACRAQNFGAIRNEVANDSLADLDCPGDARFGENARRGYGHCSTSKTRTAVRLQLGRVWIAMRVAKRLQAE
jgi:hypothetical protein